MINALIILSLGLLLGIRHATDADHVIAVSTIVSRERSLKGAARIGALWGFGHTATIMAVGAPLILFRWTISPKIGAAMELAVALMLIVLGTASLIDVRMRAYGVMRPVVIGVIHGLAGSAAITLLILTTIATPLLAIGYLLIFGIGTILGMMLLTTAIAVPVLAAGEDSGARSRLFRVAFALASISFGVFLAIRNAIPLTQL